MWLLIDNYDSFTYILHHYLLQTGNECKVVRNDEITVDEIRAMNPERIIISPGPETPMQAGISMDVIDQFHKEKPILGICLGHQAIGMYFGGELKHAPLPMHGKTSEVKHDNSKLFTGVALPFTVMRYHSLVIENIEQTELVATAHSQDGCIMALQHKIYPCTGIQFHPESVGTNVGLQLLKNWAES
jgi:anthranilate synthase/aminodeoxychorismate synthase-like glutamine amidotransferase